ncbi:acetolactate synthase large subunit [Rhizobium sp. SSA_523]|uniref:acetolactate synthase large subunit n=1 Tax=Rhizobium sp. SSA_523 TaxID=2952477 RepID=UPI002091E177|nr:acetolactate synthase large subunit [Rhizobium sp. SSA_523]MCO5732180.1 acetolactate synthase large subunit [Rhizobium sp. SSA_523]WKC21405.1 acetolactate synthase large subunit [Rhizobium sp. SSA_523]
MNGADMLCDVLLVNGIDVCFANPGTSEMHFVAALDRKPDMRCILGLSEGVVTGAADGYGRMAGKPAATLLHCGPGLANGLANLHNARRARTPMLNVVGDHASYHLQFDAPLTTDIEALARPMSRWVGRASGAGDLRLRAEEGIAAALARRGPSTLILPADAAWSEIEPEPSAGSSSEPLSAIQTPPAEPLDLKAVDAAAKALRSGARAALFLTGQALREEATLIAGRIAEATGAKLFSQTSGRYQRGAGRVNVRQVPYKIDLAVEALKDIDLAICLGSPQPVGFFAYPGKPGLMLPKGCTVLQLAYHEQDLVEALAALADALSLAADAPVTLNRLCQEDIAEPGDGSLTADAISLMVARRLPEQAIVIDEALTSIGQTHFLHHMLPPHDVLPLTGGAIGIGVPLATGAAIAAPDRKVVALQADGSGLYNVQALWTQARENLDVLTIVFANNAYRILQGEMTGVGVNAYGRNASRMLGLDQPSIDWCALAKGFGVESGSASSITEFRRLLEAGLSRRGPFLIQALIE